MILVIDIEFLRRKLTHKLHTSRN